ncbi:MAG: pentapeptide repeat-containing protein [Candidatus Brocadiae bacterium]|nr:pentapeptide repeat-containing protein [Candidatus Brocadiia bacterium]
MDTEYKIYEIKCNLCNGIHKIRFFKNTNKYRCPVTNNLFTLNSSEKIRILKDINAKDEIFPINGNEDPEATVDEDPEATVDEDPEATRYEDPEATRYEDPEATRYEDPEATRYEDPEATVDEATRYENLSKSIRYKDQKIIGQGGSATVYEAYDTKMQRKVAIKKNLDSSQINFEKFKEEAKTLATLSHPNIVNIYDYYYDYDIVEKRILSISLIMEYIQGQDIRKFSENLYSNSINKKKFFIIVAEYFSELASAIAYLHEKKIYHEDIKPQNILISHELKKIKIVDFGIATKSGEVCNNRTIRYCAPEKLDKLTLKEDYIPNAYSDIYSLGATFYEILTGSFANPGENSETIRFNIFTREITFFDTKCNETRLQNICLKCLEKDINKRYQNAKEIHFDLQSYIKDNEKDPDKVPILIDLGRSGNSIMYPILKYYFYIGRALKNDLVIFDSSLSRLQAVIYSENSIYYIKNLSPNIKIIVIKGKEKFKKITVEKGYCINLCSKDEIQISKNKFVFFKSIMELNDTWGTPSPENKTIPLPKNNEGENTIVISNLFNKNFINEAIPSPDDMTGKLDEVDDDDEEENYYYFRNTNRSTRESFAGRVLLYYSFTNQNLTEVNFSRARLTGAKFTRSDLTKATLIDAKLDEADFSEANLTDANLANTNLINANFSGANLTRANLTNANFSGANLTRANLTDANLSGANLARANLTDANFSGANLSNLIRY